MNCKYFCISFLKFSIILLFTLIKTNVLFSQKGSENKLSLHVKEESPLAVFRKIEAQCDFCFIYDEQRIDSLNQKVTITCTDESLNSVLNDIKSQTQLRFRVCDKSIAVAVQKKQISISGFVTDSLTGQNLIGAVVFIEGCKNGVTTNAYGYYSLIIPVSEVDIKCRFLGYNPKLLHLDERTDVDLNFKLMPQKTLLQ